MPASTSFLYTTLKNVSGTTKRFTFLPPHGRILTADQEITLLGQPAEAITRGKGRGQRHLEAFERSLLNGDLTIINTPNPVLYDPTLDETAILVLDGGTLSTCVDPMAASCSL
jgi:hypothetical protein